MGSVRERPDSNLLFFDFRFRGKRCREQTMLKNTVLNRRKLDKVLKNIEKEINEGTFKYEQFFPNSKNLRSFSAEGQEYCPSNAPTVQQNVLTDMPSFNDFTEIWVSENEVSWRRSHKKTQMDIINGHLLPVFGGKGVSQITKAEILAFRASLAKVPGRKNNGLSPKRMNSIMGPLRQILNEAADRYEFNTPYRNIKPLKVPKSDVEPFTLSEVSQIINTVRNDFKQYYTVRFLTGMRTGEIDGLKWKYIDFVNRQILVRETIVSGHEDYTKNDGSQREIHMSQAVYDALKIQKQGTQHLSKFVFCNNKGEALEHTNVTKRVWYPLLNLLGLIKRRPYQSRHTAATLWLAAGENPEWIARQMGHSSTEMLFRVYSRFVPNLTRQDGSAFERLLNANLTTGGVNHDSQN